MRNFVTLNKTKIGRSHDLLTRGLSISPLLRFVTNRDGYTKMEKQAEIWKPVVGYEGLYEISSLGRVRGVDRYYINSLGRKTFMPGQMLATNISKTTGYPCVSLNKDGKRKSRFIHRLIAEAFIPNPDNLPCVNHKDENRANSVLDNLEWCSYKYNLMYHESNKRRGRVKHKHFVEDGRIRSVDQYDYEGNLIATYPEGMYEIMNKFGISVKDSIFSNGTRSSHGYIWIYSDTAFDPNTMGKKRNDRIRKFVVEINADGKEVNRYATIAEAARMTGIRREYFGRAPKADGVAVVKGRRFKFEDNRSLAKYAKPSQETIP